MNVADLICIYIYTGRQPLYGQRYSSLSFYSSALYLINPRNASLKSIVSLKRAWFCHWAESVKRPAWRLPDGSQGRQANGVAENMLKQKPPLVAGASRTIFSCSSSASWFLSCENYFLLP